MLSTRLVMVGIVIHITFLFSSILVWLCSQLTRERKGRALVSSSDRLVICWSSDDKLFGISLFSVMIDLLSPSGFSGLNDLCSSAKLLEWLEFLVCMCMVKLAAEVWEVWENSFLYQDSSVFWPQRVWESLLWVEKVCCDQMPKADWVLMVFLSCLSVGWSVYLSDCT